MYRNACQNLTTRQVDYAAALRCLAAGDELSQATKEQLLKHVDLSNMRYKNLEDAIHQKIISLKECTECLKEEILDVQSQQQRLNEVQRRKYPELYHATIQNLLGCISEIQSRTYVEKQNLILGAQNL